MSKPKDTRWSCPERRRNAVCQIDHDTDGRTCIHCGQDVLERNDDTVMVHIMKDVFNGTPRKCIIVQQVNCQGVMGKGLAKSIRDRYPEVYEHYRAEHSLGLLKLGYTSYIEVEPNIYIANICGQDNYRRRNEPPKRHTDYEALRKGLEDVKVMAESLGLDIVLPHGIGCGWGGGDWRGIVQPMIDEVYSDSLVSFVYQGYNITLIPPPQGDE
jgi:O-acetyl-ADP-ribose deacetylase (regulator of RNase III)